VKRIAFLALFAAHAVVAQEIDFSAAAVDARANSNNTRRIDD